MNNIKISHPISIVAYKHNGEFHRLWRKGTVLNISKDSYIIMNNKTLIQEKTGKKWYPREPAICVFFKDKWFNVICMLKPTGVHYYCNLATPIIEDNKTLKYIDYDLDIKVFPDGTQKLLDVREYKEHKEKYNYSDELNKVIEYELAELQNMIKNKQDPFNDEFINKWKQRYEDNKNK